MRAQDYVRLADLVRRRSGLLLTKDKEPLAEARLSPVATRFGFAGLDALLSELPYPSEEVARAITEAMTTNETSFFRGEGLFRYIEEELFGRLTHARRSVKRLRIWCAAVATGQEAYSMAMLLNDAGLIQQGWRIDLIATDISEAAIARAREGLYSPFEVERGLSSALRDRYFVRENGQWRVSDRLRGSISFRTFNLLDHFGWLGELDLILCRNVLLYLEPTMRAHVMEKLWHALAVDGLLLLGENEIAGPRFAAVSGGFGDFAKIPHGRRSRP